MSAVDTTTVWTIDPIHTVVEFATKHLMITTVKGRFGAVSGTIVKNGAGSKVEVEIQAASIDTRAQQRDDHLRSADFLEVEKYPTITFASRRIDGAFDTPGDEFTVIGDLTIHGTTREVALAAVYEGQGRDPWGGERISFSAAAKIDRRDYGLTFNQTLETGGVLVGNDLKVTLEVQATKSS
ncbi:MAG: YceI family protein [Gemmatimonadales bacterium]|nr:YceI family protein [Gemmatimonadales bacterium]